MADALAADLRAAGATVERLDVFDPTPLPGEGVYLCVLGERVRVYVQPSAADAAAVAATIDRDDPTHVGSAIVEWAGNPTFWRRGSAIVLYFGSDADVRATLMSVLGDPFATGQGTGLSPEGEGC